jgi:hypothetical protein
MIVQIGPDGGHVAYDLDPHLPQMPIAERKASDAVSGP